MEIFWKLMRALMYAVQALFDAAIVLWIIRQKEPEDGVEYVEETHDD
ncbi:MAG: hypothetical protein IJV58_00370 [Oscillospiraceae bacterium]|nr:hypothetical protein [Oscillospiraceae bacterium]